MFKKMHLIEYPTGRWGFVGSVHESLAGKTFRTERAARLASQFAERFGSLPITQTIRHAA